MDVFSPAQLVGYVALVLGITSFLQKKDRNLKIFNASQCLVYTIHFLLLGNPSAAGSAFVSAIRSGVALRWRMRALAFVFIAFNLIVGITQARTPAGWLPVAGCCIATYGLFFMSGVRMRLMFLASTCLWVTNNILSGSIGGTILESSIFLTNGSQIIRMLLTEFSRSRITMTGGVAALRLAAPQERIQRSFPFARRMHARRRARTLARNQALRLQAS